MLDIVLESARFFFLLFISIFLLRADNDVQYGRDGWRCIKAGFFLILFGTLIDITDNFEQLNWTIFLGDTPVQAFLEKFVGYLGGFALLSIGFANWLPAVQRIGKMEKELRRQKQRAEFVFDNAPIGIAYGRIGELQKIYRNNEFTSILGYSSSQEIEELSREKGTIDFLWQDPTILDGIIEQLRTSPRITSVEAPFYHKDGSTVWMLLDFVTLKNDDGENAFFYCFGKDITEHKQMVKVLSESESRLKTIINAMPAGIYLVEVESQTIVDANYAATNMSGYSYEELVGSHCCGKLCPRKEGECPLIKSGGSVRNNENIFTRKDGTEFSVMKTAVRIRMNGKDYFLETFVDISEQKRLEQLKEDVDRIVQHDLRSPISSIINATTLSLLDESVQGEHREVLEIIKQKGYKVLNMMGLSLAMYKMEAGTFKYVPEQLELMRIIQRVLKELEILTRDKNITVQIRLNGKAMGNRSSLYVKGDKLLMESMLSNLLKNCIEATDYDQQFSLDIDKDKDLTMIFSNPGVVPENIRDTFFDKYATAGKKSGTGLGTYSANLIATTVGGSITMKTSDEENKTTITVRLPVG